MKLWRGGIHIHTTYSDGGGAMEEVIEAAREAGLDYIIISDHDLLDAKRDGWEGYHDGLLVIVGMEICPNTNTHILGLGVNRVADFEQMTEVECLDDVRAQGGCSFLAHPEGAYRRNLGIDLERWRCWGHPGFVGIELWSFMHDWIKGFKWFRLRDFHRRPLAKIAGPEPKLLAQWDELNRHRRVVGLAALDAHAKRLLGMTFFPYKFLFRTTLTYVETGDPSGDAARDIRMLLGALAGGRSYMAYEPYESARGFRFTACGPSGIHRMGDRVEMDSVDRLSIEMPDACHVRVVHDGRIVEEIVADVLEYDELAPGPWRIEGWLEGYPWVFSNHITLL